MDKKAHVSIDDYLSRQPKQVQDILRLLRIAIQKAAPKAMETIKYQIPTFTYEGNLVHFAAFKKHIGFYPTPSGISVFAKELSGYVTAKGSVQFPIQEPLPLSLISKIVKFRVAENRNRATAGKKK